MLIIWIEFIEPDVVDSTTDDCCVISLDSTIKSLSANWSETLYGYVFLTKFEFSISNWPWVNL